MFLLLSARLLNVAHTHQMHNYMAHIYQAYVRAKWVQAARDQFRTSKLVPCRHRIC